MIQFKIATDLISRLWKPALFVLVSLILGYFVYTEYQKKKTIIEQKQEIARLKESLNVEKQAKEILAKRLVKEKQLSDNLQLTLTTHRTELENLKKLQVENTKVIEEILKKNEVWASQKLPTDLKAQLKK